MKALEKDRSRRYGAPSELAADIRRYLNHEPVLARPASAAYRSGKFVKRHKFALAVASVFALTMLAGVVAIVREAQIARMQEARAERRFNDVRSLANSLLFDVYDSIQDLPGSTPARRIVADRALHYLDTLSQQSAGSPDLEPSWPQPMSASATSRETPFSPTWATPPEPSRATAKPSAFGLIWLAIIPAPSPTRRRWWLPT